MKKLLPLFLVMLLIFTSCAPSAKNPSDTTGDDDGIVYPETDTKGKNVTYVITQNGAIPISIVDGGYSMLSGENYYYNLQNTVDMNPDISKKTFTAFSDSGINLGSSDFDKMTGDNYKTLVTSGNWKLCPNIRKTTYSSKKADTSYAEFIFSVFPDNFASVSDVNVTDVWELDTDSDGTNEAVVKAAGDNYVILVFLSQTLGNFVLACDFEHCDTYVATPFFADLDGNGCYSLCTLYGAGLKTFCVYKENTLDEEYRVYLPI
jgi:hypothetical protein